MRQFHIVTTLAIIAFMLISSIFVFNKQSDDTTIPYQYANEEAPEDLSGENASEEIIMAYMGNKTQKEELGRATWKFLHTMMARYPETPTRNERKSLYDFMMLFSTLYPCGECATHFNKMITEFPPQTSSRFAASQWLCGMHNKVNERLHKAIFDCSSIESQYPCGCNEPEDE